MNELLERQLDLYKDIYSYRNIKVELEKRSQLIVDIDLLCADRKFAYDLVTCVEKTGLK